jgi:hypothetical protein
MSVKQANSQALAKITGTDSKGLVPSMSSARAAGSAIVWSREKAAAVGNMVSLRLPPAAVASSPIGS